MFCFIVSAAALLGAWYILKDVPGGKVQKINGNFWRSKPMDVA